MMLGFDALATVAGLTLATLFRFEGLISGPQLEAFQRTGLLLVVLRLASNAAFGLHRWSFRLSGLTEAVRIVLASLAATCTLCCVLFFISGAGVSRLIIALEFFTTTGLMAAYRYLPRVATLWYRDLARSRDETADRTLIVGAGHCGDLLIRDLLTASNHHYRVLGFLDDDRKKLGSSVGGRPVLGRLTDLSELIQKHRIAKVLIAIPRLESVRIRELLRMCSHLGVSFKIIPSAFSAMDKRITAAMLHDLSPEDLLPRDQIRFDPAEFRDLIRGRRILVTGAAGSIGSEIARQVASHGPSELVLVDINENELYFLNRRLEEQYPSIKLHTLIADIRDQARVDRIGRKYRPQYVFHAAAHKHVPLMETAPDEAVKNNVFGTLNVAQMADRCGAERFVLISTDKAVRPSSVMGATKRIAELIVRGIARDSQTRFSAVRFGNVLGSAGSVVPLFKEQIQRGGPVTVTHPECTRYFMTIPEAVGLVILAGLKAYGELCILDMGEPIRIAELASNMITMAGLVPGKDIPIAFTGLRPGEKLFEELLTEEEEQTEQVRDRIKTAIAAAPPTNLTHMLEQLRSAADTGDHTAVRAVIQTIVPTYSEPGAPARSGAIASAA